MATYSTGEQTRQILISATGELVAERGLGMVTTRAIAERADENVGSIHYHFGSKDELLKETLSFAIRGRLDVPLQKLIDQYKDGMDQIEVQIQAVRTVVEQYMIPIFAPDRPLWCSRVIYQTLQHPGELRDYLRREVIDPDYEAIGHLLRRIHPEISDEDVALWIHLAVGPFIFHSDHRETLLQRLGTTSFSKSYLDKLAQRVVDDALRMLGLPTNHQTEQD